MTLNKNNNRAIVRQLARRNVRMSGRTSRLTTLTIAITAMLVTAMVLQVMGMVSNQKAMLEQTPQVTYMNLNKEQMMAIQADWRVNSAIAYKMGQGVEEHGILVQPSYYEPSTPEMESMLRLSEGRMAQSMDEVALDKSTLRTFGLSETLGTQVTVHFLNGSPETFTVVGLTDYEARGVKLSQHLLYLSRTYAQKGVQLAQEPWFLMTQVNGGADMSGPMLESLVYQLGEAHGVIHQNVNPNDRYIDLRTVSFTNLLIYIGIAMVLIFVSLIVIYSIFYLSVAGRVRQFGQLRAIGMTPKQLRCMVKLEGWQLCSLGTPAGFMVASFFMLAFGPENGWTLFNNLMALMASTLVCAVAVRLGVQKPATLAAATSPIEATRFQSWKGKNELTSATPRSLTPWGLAKLNFARSWKKQLLTMLSLAVGGILFMTSMIYVNAWQLEGYSRQGEFKDSEYAICFDYNTENSLENGRSAMQLQGLLGKPFQSAISDLPDVENLTSYHGVSTRFRWNGIEGNDALTPIDPEDASVLETCLQEGVGDYGALVKSGGVYVSMSGSWKELYGKVPKIGDEIEFTYYNGETCTVLLPVVGIGGNKVRQLFPDSSFCIIPRETADLLFGNMDTTRMLSISMKEDSHTPMQDEEMRIFLAEYPQLKLITLTEQMESAASTYATTQALFFAIAGFVVLFSLVNLLNTLLSSLMTRRQQLALLAALGMTKRQIRKMLDLEGLLLAGVNLTATLTLGTLAGWGVCQLMAAIGANYVQFTFPVLWFLLYMLIAIGAPTLITRICLKSFYHESLTQRLQTTE